VQQYLQLAQEAREHIHANPELSFEEYKTSAYVQQQLTAYGISFVANIAGTGIVASVQGSNANKHCIAFRSELDALPITEANQVAYKSLNTGVMHACGHDFHTATMLAAAKYLHEHSNEFEGTFKFIFQPGEEKDPGGASIMIAEGVLEQAPKIESIFALHVYPSLPAGKVGTRGGTYMASADEIYITIKGKGGHAAMPHQCIDPILIASHVLIGLQDIISRKRNPIDPTVLTFGKIAGGTKGNIIPDEVTLDGTLRCMNEAWRAECHKLITNYAQQIARNFGGDAEVKILVGYPCVHNDEALTQQVNRMLSASFKPEDIEHLPLRMTADDFAFYSHQIPGCYIRIGTSNADASQCTSGVHTNTFDIDAASYKSALDVVLAISKGYGKTS
jgi:amidohydrolase